MAESLLQVGQLQRPVGQLLAGRGRDAGRRKGRADAAPTVNDKERDDEQRADETEFLANHGIDEIGVRLGQVKQLLLAFHQADAGKPSGAHSNQRLPQLKASALRVGAGIPKREKAGHAIRSQRDQQIERGESHRESGGDPFPGKSRDKQNRRGEQKDVHRCAKVGLGKD